ncbi:MAG: hypothetical protein Q8R30_04380 [bacterium]|nr:hypothetical protein [bacterium]MDZ4285610.1 hypothetical protein [Candidatus Sungbacteria bacterium]
MIYAIYGSDTYRCRKKLNQIIEAYRAKAGAYIDLHYFDAKTDDLAGLKSMMDVQSLFTPKKLVVVKNAFNEAMTETFDHAKGWKEAKDQHLVLVHEALDAASKKQLKVWDKALTQSQEFELFEGAKKEAWIRSEAIERGVSLIPDQIRSLAISASDSWEAVQEIEKIAVGGEVDLAVYSGPGPTVFDLGDAFFTDKKRAIGILHRLLEKGEDEFGLFSYLVNRSRVLVAVKQCVDQRKPIPSWLGIHPFVAKKTESLARGLSLAQCGSFMSRFFEEDARIKIGLSQPKESMIQMLME